MCFVKRVGRLVQQLHLRPHRKDSGQRYQALFAAGEMVCDAIGEMVKFELLQQAPGRLDLFGMPHAKIKRAERDVIDDGRAKELIVWILKQIGCFGAYFVKVRFCVTAQAKAVISPVARSHYGAQQSCLANTVVADQSEPLSSRERQGKIIENTPAVPDHTNIAKFDQCIHATNSTTSSPTIGLRLHEKMAAPGSLISSWPARRVGRRPCFLELIRQIGNGVATLAPETLWLGHIHGWATVHRMGEDEIERNGPPSVSTPSDGMSS